MNDGMLLEDYHEPTKDDQRKDLCLRLVQKCPTRIVFGDKAVAADTYRVGTNSAGLGFFELRDPHEDGIPIEAVDIRKCSAVFIFKNQESIDTLREWLGAVEDALAAQEKVKTESAE